MIKKIISSMLAAALTLTTLAVASFAEEGTIEEEKCPVGVSASWDNYTTAGVDFSFPSDNSVKSAAITFTDDFYLNDNVKNKSVTLNAGRRIMADLNLQDVSSTSVKVVKSIEITYSNEQVKTFDNIDTCLSIEGSFSSTANWTKVGTAAQVNLNSSNFARIGEALVGNCANITFTCELNDGFVYEKGEFIGLSSNKKGDTTVVWTYSPKDNEKNKYSLSGNGVYFTVNYNGMGTYNADGKLPVFKLIKITDGTTEIEIDSPILDYARGTLGATAQWLNNEQSSAQVNFTSENSALIGQTIIGNCNEVIYTGVLNDGFTYNKGTFNGLKGNRKGDTTVVWTYSPDMAKGNNAVNFTVDYNGTLIFQDGKLPVFKSITVTCGENETTVEIPTLDVEADKVMLTLSDGGAVAANEYTWGTVIETAPTAAGLSGYNFSGWTIDGDVVTFPYTLTGNTTMTASYTVIPATPVVPTEPEVTTPEPQIDPTEPDVIIPDDETPLAGAPDFTDGVIIGDEDTPLGEIPTGNNADPLANPNTSDRSITGTAMMIALAATAAAVIAFKKKK